MKKIIQKLTALTLVFVILVALVVNAAAMWPAVAVDNSDNYLSGGILYSNGKPITKNSLTVGGFIQVYLLEDSASSIMTPTSVDFGISTNTKGNTIDLEMGKSYDFSIPFHYNVTSADGRTAPVFVFATEETGGWSGWTEQDEDELLGMSELIANTFVQITKAIYTIEATETEVGSYHPGNAEMLKALSYWLGMSTAYYSEPAAGENGNRLFNPYLDLGDEKWQKGGDEAVAFVRTYLQTYLNKKPTPSSGSPCYMKPSALRIIYEKIVPWYLNYALDTRIAEPTLKKVSVGGSVGTVDEKSGIVTVLLPEGTDVSKLNIEVTAADGCKAKSVAGSLEQKSLAYTVTPYDTAYGAEYSALAKTWKIQIETGTPRNEVTSFAITVNGKTRYASIDQTKKTVTLNLPVGTDLTALKPEIEHTGTSTSMDGKTQDFTTPQTLTLENKTFSLTSEYTVTVTANKSDENSILSYKLGNSIGTVSGKTVSIEIPYAEDLSKLTPVIEISEFATITKPASLQVGANSYTVTSESGKVQIWTVNITRAAVATGNQIVSFCYGSVEAVIDQALGTVTMELPAGSSTTFAPVVVVSPYATVSPASGAKQSFASPVKYTVTSQSGTTNTYTVTVKVAATAAENEYKSKMESLVQKAITRYRTSASIETDDWEYMNIGFYDKKLNNMDKNHGERPQFYAKNTHPPIIAPEIFEAVQKLMAERKKSPRAAYSEPSQVLRRKIICGQCATPYQRKLIGGVTYWICRQHNQNPEKCKNKAIPEIQIQIAFQRLYWKLKHHGEPIFLQMLSNLQRIRYARMLWSEDVVSLNRKISDTLSQIQLLAQLQQRSMVDPDTFISQNNKLSEQLRRWKQEKSRLLDTDSDDMVERTRDIMDTLADGPDFLDHFDAELFAALVEKIIVDSNTQLRFRLINGLELTEQIERTRR